MSQDPPKITKESSFLQPKETKMPPSDDPESPREKKRARTSQEPRKSPQDSSFLSSKETEKQIMSHEPYETSHSSVSPMNRYGEAFKSRYRSLESAGNMGSESYLEPVQMIATPGYVNSSTYNKNNDDSGTWFANSDEDDQQDYDNFQRLGMEGEGKILDVVERLWADGGNIAGLVNREDVPIPEKQTSENPEEIQAWKWSVRKANKNIFRERHSLRCDVEHKLSVARKMKEEEGFYYPHNLDFRGHAYPMHPHLNHLSSDLCRRTLMFAEGRPLGKSGLHWLRIHLANLCAGGVEKLSLDGRLACHSLFLCLSAWITTVEATKQVVPHEEKDWTKMIYFAAGAGCTLLLLCVVGTFLWIRSRRGEGMREEDTNSLINEAAPSIEENRVKYVEDEINELEDDSSNEFAEKEKITLIQKYFHHDDKKDLQQINNSEVYVREKGIGNVLDGVFANRPVSVKRVLPSEEIFNEIKKLTRADGNTKHILRYYCYELEDNCMYSCVESFICSFEDLIVFLKENRNTNLSSWESKVYLRTKSGDQLLIELLRDVVKGVVHLHSKGIIHRDLHPDNIMIVCDGDRLIAKIGDLSIAWAGKDDPLKHNCLDSHKKGWQAPEQLKNMEETSKVDIFNSGCLIYYTLSRRQHPFKFRENKIRNQPANLVEVQKFPEAFDLIGKLVEKSVDSRPTALEVLRHPFFWSSHQKIAFLTEVGSQVKGWDVNGCNPDPVKLAALESRASQATDAHDKLWKAKLDGGHLGHMEKHRAKYVDGSLAELLRLIRNTKVHYGELGATIQTAIGGDPFRYFDGLFPKLLMEVYQMVYDHCKGDPGFDIFF